MENIIKVLYKSVALIAIIAFIGGGVAFVQNVASLVSFEVGLLGFLFVVASSFVTLLKRVSTQNTLTSSEDKHLRQAEETNNAQNSSNFSTRFVIGAQMSLSFLRILSYALFALMIIGLFEYQLFVLEWFFAGLCIAMILCVVIGIFYISKSR
ncbi:hypothetical protein OQH61_00050 [Helicobacter sp. MIT 21-1697]|uniref:hypothetical protein n=1 Tax=Helicobacter sp. MIT 21-1697 TaxID=2993733 RepID=UPI00224B1600|nr:hypothetical protein [Helicobacter sp. MIT 21-1697]MCX2716131.1 hypothetical protein [Helicobacter sp. MIT 21-1697]